LETGDIESLSVQKFFTNFSKHYPELAQEIFFLNSEQGLEKLTNFSSENDLSTGAMIEEGLQPAAISSSILSIENLPRMTSLSIVSLIIKSSPWLTRVSKIVDYLKKIQSYDEEDILERIETFQDPNFLRSLQNFDFSEDFMDGGQGQTFRNLYELIAEVVMKKGISEAISVL